MKNYEGNNYKFKKNSIKKMKKKYSSTYHYLLKKILYNNYNISIYISLEEQEDLFNSEIINVIESTALDLNINNNKIYNYNNFNKIIRKSFHKSLKKDNCNNISLINYYKMMKKNRFKDLRLISIVDEDNFFKALYLYTICED